ncbi:choline dehydrogenase [Stakelama sp. CBK3Z-3]|uniref:Choline dehydrogenase n=1 Tax=Stakelama flava TaxID=2860338 RepID=A0ABS6XN29_9SPHN|nr:choline dehydrogenase [Stakelama flava]
MSTAYDYIIVGAGSAGCVLADRLTADGRNSVLVLEFGGSDRSVFIQMPSALSIPMNSPKFDWGYRSEPEPGLAGRRMHTPRGKVIGGSSSINGMVYVRGNPMDFEGWADQGAAGWDYAQVLPYFMRAESRAEGGTAYRGDRGPLHNRYGRLKNPLYTAFIDAAHAAGYPVTSDINGGQQEGFGRMDMTVHNGRRWSAANAYLKPALKRPNLTLITHAMVDRILFEGNRAVGLRYRQGDTEHEVRAGHEVIVSSGPINSPHLLKRSGIGPAAELARFDIPVVHDLPGVGENLQDHLEFYLQMECTQPITLYSVMNPIAKARIGAQWLLTKKGLGATNHFESCGFIRSAPGIPYPDIQFHFLPLAVSYDGSAAADRHGYQAHVGPMRSKSRGNVTLSGPRSNDRPSIRFNYMSHPDDWAEMRACLRLTREIFAQDPLKPFTGREMSPGADIVSDEQIDAWIAQKVESAYHPSCTCKIGADDDMMAVVDPQLRVRGVEALRVVDSSVMPAITTGNLNAPTIMIAEKAADHILGKQMLAPSEIEYSRASNWRDAQR